MATQAQGAATATRRSPPRWRNLDLDKQFLVASILTTVIAMAIVGTWLTKRIAHTVTQNTALQVALYVESFVGERIQSLEHDPSFDPAVQEQLERLVTDTPLGRRIISFKVWLTGGRVIYASRPEHVGRTYEPTPSLREAWTGIVQAELDSLDAHENAVERSLDVPLLEVYVPIRKRFGGDVLAVVEFYEDASGLTQSIIRAKLEAWLLLGLIGSGVVAALYGMAKRASQTIKHQRAALDDRIYELSDLLDQNVRLRHKIESTSRRAASLNEMHLRRLGSDLHDGPAQMLSLAMLRLDALRPATSIGDGAEPTAAELPEEERGRIRKALEEALRDIRNLSLGLSMPELDRASLEDTIREAARAHEHRTDERVRLELSALPDLTRARDLKIAAYRFIQEGLNNASQHAAGTPVTVWAGADRHGGVMIEVADEGPGFDVKVLERTDRLGLLGLKERIECTGGTLEVRAGTGQGTRITARWPTETAAHHDQ